MGPSGARCIARTRGVTPRDRVLGAGAVRHGRCFRALEFLFGVTSFERFLQSELHGLTEVARAGEAVFELSNLVSGKTVTPGTNRIEALRDWPLKQSLVPIALRVDGFDGVPL
jgi:hypothetical protein